jgi:hypothetical protein
MAVEVRKRKKGRSGGHRMVKEEKEEEKERVVVCVCVWVVSRLLR